MSATREFIDSYKVRPSDPHERREHPDAHEVLGPHSLIGVWEMKHQAEAVAAALNQWAGSQLR